MSGSANLTLLDLLESSGGAPLAASVYSYSPGGGRRLLHNTRPAKPRRASTGTPTPTPIPILAPVDSPPVLAFPLKMEGAKMDWLASARLDDAAAKADEDAAATLDSIPACAGCVFVLATVLVIEPDVEEVCAI